MRTVLHVLRSKGKRKIPAELHAGMFDRFPQEITLEILSRLPTGSILECRQVCKTWRNLIRHPSFAHMHLRRNVYPCKSSVTGDKLGSGFLFVFAASNGSILYYGEYDDKPHQKLRRINQPSINGLFIVGSHNGLICFSDRSGSDFWSMINEPVYISNPITREYMRFPRLEVNDGNKVDSMVCGFGYLPSTDSYKIIKIFYIKNQPMGRVQIYTLGGGSCIGWRDIGETTYSLRHTCINLWQGSRYILDYPHQPCPFGIFANGALHWLDKEQKIVSFDLAEENFYLLRSPEFVSDSSLTNSFQLQVLGGCLCFIHKKEDELLDAWFLRKKGDSSSCDVNEQEDESLTWTKELSLPIDASPIALTEGGEFLMWYKSNLCCYDPKTATMKNLVLYKDFCHARPHMNSFVSLKALGGKCQSRKRYAVNPSPTGYFIVQQTTGNGELDVIQF